MLLSFKITNYKSIKDAIKLDLTATSINELSETNVITNDKESILKSALIYGHNASGKSNLLDGLVEAKWQIINSAKETQSNEKIDLEPFLLHESTESKPSSFEFIFLKNNIKYKYGFEADENKIISEWLFETKKEKYYEVFVRRNEEYKIVNSRFKGGKELVKKTRSNALFISVCSQWNQEKAVGIVEWFSNIITIHGLIDDDYRGATLELMNEDSKIVSNFLKNADLGIQGVEKLESKVNKDEFINDAPEELKGFLEKNYSKMDFVSVKTKHKYFSNKNEEIGFREFSMDQHESEGTKKFFNLSGKLIRAVQEDSVIVIDELEARLHSKLTEAIVRMFSSSKSSKAQLIGTSHDTSLISSKFLRRDQIYFIEKNKFGASELSSLVEYQERTSNTYESKYLDGRYGAIPFIEDFRSVFDD